MRRIENLTRQRCDLVHLLARYVIFVWNDLFFRQDKRCDVVHILLWAACGKYESDVIGVEASLDAIKGEVGWSHSSS